MLDHKERLKYLFDSLKTLMTINAGLLAFLALHTDFEKLSEIERNGTSMFCIVLAIIFGIHLFILLLLQNLVQVTDEE